MLVLALQLSSGGEARPRVFARGVTVAAEAASRDAGPRPQGTDQLPHNGTVTRAGGSGLLLRDPPRTRGTWFGVPNFADYHQRSTWELPDA
jgi:hypothetical protein